jgi:Cu-Zn family superoxide dismutase
MSNPNLSGVARFYNASHGIVIVVEVHGLPISTETCSNSLFGLHIHEGTSCTGPNIDHFADSGTFINPHHCAHPEALGELPPLYGGGGEALGAVLINGITIDQIVGHTIVIYAPVDFPAAQYNPEKIACGQIVDTGCTRTP